MPGLDVEAELSHIAYVLWRAGLLDLDRLIEILSMYRGGVYICHGRVDYEEIASMLRYGPVLLECDVKRAHRIYRVLKYP